MAVKRVKVVIAFGDSHIPNHSESALGAVRRAVESLTPSDICLLGDMLDCSAFSTHPPSHGETPGDYEQDLRRCNRLIDDVMTRSDHVAYLCGNHEYRIARFAARAAEGAATFNMLAPEVVLSRGRNKRRFTMIPYAGGDDGAYPHYAITPNLVAVHGWSYAIAASRRHLQMSQGRSVVFGHTHRISTESIQNLWGSSTVQAINPGCTCKLIPTYNAGRVVEWAHAFAMFYISRRNPLDWTGYVVPITNGRCVLPDGKEIKA